MSELDGIVAPRNSKCAHGVLDGLHDDRDWDYQPIDDYILDSAAVEDFLSCIAGEAKVAIAQVFRANDAGNIDIRHHRRFDQHNAHFATRLRCYPAQVRAYRTASARAFHALFSLSSAYGSRLINYRNRALDSSRAAFISTDEYSNSARRGSSNDVSEWAGEIASPSVSPALNSNPLLPLNIAMAADTARRSSHPLQSPGQPFAGAPC